MYKREFEIDVLRCVNALIKKKGLIAIVTFAFFFIGFGLTLNVGEDMYTSVATVYAAADTNYLDAANAVTAMNAYLDVATSYKVSQRAALIMGRNDIDAVDIQDALSVSSSGKKSGTSAVVSNFLNSSATIISFSVTTNDPELSRDMADAAAESYVIEMANILKIDAIKSLDSAHFGELTYNANKEAWKFRILLMLAGAFLACFVIVICEIFDKKVRTIREATLKDQLPIIGIIPDYIK